MKKTLYATVLSCILHHVSCIKLFSFLVDFSRETNTILMIF